MTPELLTERLKSAYGTCLISVLLYGSTVAGDRVEKRSDYNVLVVLARLGVEELKTAAKIIRPWVRRGNPVPVIATPDSLGKSTDVFPLEIVDIQKSHRILFGADVISALLVSQGALRFEVERELKSKLLQLRSQYLLVHHRPRQVTRLMVRSISTFLVLCRGALRLFQADVPMRKLDALQTLAQHVPLRVSAFEHVMTLKARRRVPGLDVDRIFQEYLQAIELVVGAVDDLLHKQLTQPREGR